MKLERTYLKQHLNTFMKFLLKITFFLLINITFGQNMFEYILRYNNNNKDIYI
jgi:hypothetical protein